MLEIIDLAKRYGDVVALDGATLHGARRAGSSASSGPNGAGKTTTMRCIFGLAPPDRGEVRWDGPADRPRDAAALRLHARAARPLPADARRRAAHLLRPAARDVGPRRRAATAGAGSSGSASPTGRSPSSRTCRTATSSASSSATALVHDPELLVLDEPFSGLDPIGIATMTEILRERAAAGVGVVFSTPPARPRRGRLRGRRDHRPRRGSSPQGAIDELQGRVRAAAPRGRGRRAPAAPGSTAGPAHRRSSATGDRVKLLVDDGRRPRRAAGRGAARPVEVRRFALPAADAVGAVHGGRARHRSRSARRSSDEPPAGRLAGRPARDPRARPEPRLPPLARVHGRSCSSPGSSCRRSSLGDDEPTRLGRRRASRRPGSSRRSQAVADASPSLEVAVATVPDVAPRPRPRLGDGTLDAALVVPADGSPGTSSRAERRSSPRSSAAALSAPSDRSPDRRGRRPAESGAAPAARRSARSTRRPRTATRPRSSSPTSAIILHLHRRSSRSARGS